MMNFFNSIPENIGWMVVGAVLMLVVIVAIDVIRMAVIGIKGRLEKDEDESPCPLCGTKVKPSAEDEENRTYKCSHCGAKWTEKW